MARRALLIGSATGELTGPDLDVARMSALLQKRGFTIDSRTGKNATRDGILDGYSKLIADTAAGDVALFGYTGHGALTIDSGGGATTMFQNIVPFDYDASTETDYRGISALELSLRLRMLLEKTKNAIVILDCCHSAQMSRDGAVRDATPRALPHPLRVSVEAYHAALRALYPGVEIAPQGNSEAIRLVACAQEQVAYEYTNAKNVRTGAFTEALVEILEDVGDAPMSWGVIARAVRERVLRRFPTQRPDLAGPVKRQLFALAEINANDGVVPIIRANAEYRIGAGQIQAVTVGDVYNVAALAKRDEVIAKATVTKVAPTSATVTVAGETVPQDAIAIPLRRATPMRPIAVVAPPDELATITAELAKARTVRTATPDDGDRVLATLRVVDGRRYAIEDGRGAIFPPTEGLGVAVTNLANLAVAQALRELVGEHGIAIDALDCELGLFADGERRPLPDSGAPLSCGDAIYCRVVNRSRSALYVNAFSLGLRGSVSLLSQNEKLFAGEEMFVANPRGRAPEGLELSWPDGFPTTVPGIDSILIIATPTATDLSMLETVERGVSREGASRGPENELQQLVAQFKVGGTRDAKPPRPAEGYLVRRVSWVLHPRVGAIASDRFLIDNSPRNEGAARSADAWVPSVPRPPARIAIRLNKLVVEKTHAWLPADVRVDALICTRSDGNDPGYHASTVTFSRIRGGQTLPLDNVLLFEGPVRDFVDICVWVSRDKAPTNALADLLAQRAQDPKVQDALGALIAGAGAVAAPWIAAVGASAVLAHTAYEVISAFAGSAIGLYRTSFLAREQYGVGRYPAEGLYRAQDFSFSLVVDATEVAS
ncbi:MAG TPA: caspase family protein [Kofleriaceae bacterium]|jgi:hypothetical protein